MKRNLLLMALCCGAMACSAWAEEAVPSSVRFALKVEGQEQVLAPGSMTIVLDPRTIIPAAAKAAKLDPAACRMESRLVSMSKLAGRQVFLLQVTTHLTSGDNAQTEAFAEQALAHIRKYLQNWGDGEKEALERRLDVLRGEADRLAEEITADQQAELARAVEDRGAVSVEEVLERMQRAKRNILDLQMTLEADRARQQALARHLGQARDEMEERIAGDPAMQELKKIVDLREQALERVKKLADAGTSTQGDIGAVMEKLAEAKLAIYRRREEAAGRGSGDMMDKLRQEMLAIEVDADKHELLMKAAAGRLEDLVRKAKEGPVAGEWSVDLARHNLDRLMSAHSRIANEILDLEMVLRTMGDEPIRVTLMTDIAAGAMPSPPADEDDEGQ